MEKFCRFTGKVIPLPLKNVDTDMIIPAQYLTHIDKTSYGMHLFARLKESHPDFVFNDLRYKDAPVLLSESNFGCGSSREHAVWALMQAGIKTIIAESFSDIFSNNAATNGLLLITLSKADIEALFTATHHQHVFLTIDLAEQQVLNDRGQSYTFQYDPFRKTCLLTGFDDMDYLLNALTTIRAFKNEKKYCDFSG